MCFTSVKSLSIAKHHPSNLHTICFLGKTDQVLMVAIMKITIPQGIALQDYF